MAAVVASLALTVASVDRPVARFAHDVLRVGGKEQWYFVALTDIPDALPVLANVILAGYVLAILLGARPGRWGRLALEVAVVVVVAVALKDAAKLIAGRPWPETWTNDNPSYIKDGVFGFFPLKPLLERTGRAYLAFPSGHMTIIAAACTALALHAPRLRRVAPVPVVLVAIGMIGANYHWVSDLIGGAALGAAIALAARRAGDRAWGGEPHRPLP
jgi:membrane-associated phospholipid phosphatase